MTLYDAEPDPPFALWRRDSRRCKWRVYARADSALEALSLMRGGGDWMLIGPPGYDPNETDLAAAQALAPR